MRSSTLTILFMLSFVTTTLQAKDVIIVLGDLNNPDTKSASIIATSQLNKQGRFQVWPLATVAKKLADVGVKIEELTTYSDAVSSAKKIEVDALLWLEGWDDTKQVFSGVFYDLHTNDAHRALGKMHEKSRSLAPHLVRGVAVTATEGKMFASISAETKPPNALKTKKWGAWDSPKQCPKRKRAATLLEIDIQGEIKRSWSLKSNCEPYADKARSFTRSHYSYEPAMQDGQAVACYAIINTAAKKVTMDPEELKGNNTLWAYVLLERL